MIRREFLTTALGFLLKSSYNDDFVINGWVPYNAPSQPTYQFASSKGRGKIVLLYKDWEEYFNKEWVAHRQLGPDCVAQAIGGGLNLLTILQKDKWIKKSSTDAIFAGGRNMVHSGAEKFGGVPASWCIEYLQKYGNLLRLKYGKYDLRPYNARTVQYWANKKIPMVLWAEAKKHPLVKAKLITSWTMLRAAITSRHPVIFCARMGADNSERDKEGFLNPSGRWAHAWLVAGIDDEYKRPGALLINSHGSGWGSGPKRHDQPNGSVWVDAAVLDKHLKAFRDSYALIKYRGYKKREYKLW